MRIVVNHLTRMRRGYICVAGINLATGEHVRPLPRNGDLRYRDLAAHGGLLEVGAVLDLGTTKSIGRAPEIEDTEFFKRSARTRPDLEAAEFWTRMKSTAKPTLIELFGRDLHEVGHAHAAVDVGHGERSLGMLIITKSRPELVIEPRQPRPRLRMNLQTGRIPLSVAVTDIRLYGPDHVTPDPDAVAIANERLTSSAEVLLSVGLSRAYSDWLSNDPERHWLQINNLHFIESPYWRLPPGPEPA